MNQTLLRYVTYSRAPNKRTGWLLENEHYTHLVSQWGRFGNIQKRNLSSLLSFWGHSHLCLLLQNTFLCKSKHGWLCSQKIFKLRQTKLSQFSNEISGPDICSLIQGEVLQNGGCTPQSTLILENLKPVEISKNHFNFTLTSSKLYKFSKLGGFGSKIGPATPIFFLKCKWP